MSSSVYIIQCDTRSAVVKNDDDDKFLKVMLYYNVKAVCYFANPHDRATSVQKYSVAELIEVKDLNFISWDTW
jgi:hypothetical protein